MRQKARAGDSLFDRLRRLGSGDDLLLALLAGVSDLHMLEDEQRGRRVFQLLAHHLADLLPFGPAARAAEFRSRQRVLDRLSRQELRQRFAAVAATFSAGFIRGGFLFIAGCASWASAPGGVIHLEQLRLPRIVRTEPFSSRTEDPAFHERQFVRQLVQKLLLLSDRLRRLGQGGGELCFARQ